ncbi:MAG TPA: microviridin/marinostatin family tricyclic proteinase inhibitor [Archangium sp.]|jgi:hypothetical protein|uniref:microviridin/marinostatin family tricyclic proteinase inhibitor n=1 Tax=Archangium sp. TaxID=1872627 RepID=UPI002ED7A451
MEKNEKGQKQQGKKPFFARLLETQELDKVSGGLASQYDATNKAPSDTDEVSKPPEP